MVNDGEEERLCLAAPRSRSHYHVAADPNFRDGLLLVPV